MLDRFRFYDWSFSGTAEWVIGALLALTLVIATFA
jgi:hypothetical protein